MWHCVNSKIAVVVIPLFFTSPLNTKSSCICISLRRRKEERKEVDVNLASYFQKFQNFYFRPLSITVGWHRKRTWRGGFAAFFFPSFKQSFKYLSSTAKRRETTLPSPWHWQQGETESAAIIRKNFVGFHSIVGARLRQAPLLSRSLVNFVNWSFPGSLVVTSSSCTCVLFCFFTVFVKCSFL